MNGCLHAAAREGQPELVKQLLAAGADIEAADADGLTPGPLCAAVKHNQRAVVEVPL
jgi:ankyrin repeat protein